jgi:hypothetical protein
MMKSESGYNRNASAASGNFFCKSTLSNYMGHNPSDVNYRTYSSLIKKYLYRILSRDVLTIGRGLDW